MQEKKPEGFTGAVIVWLAIAVCWMLACYLGIVNSWTRYLDRPSGGRLASAIALTVLLGPVFAVFAWAFFLRGKAAAMRRKEASRKDK